MAKPSRPHPIFDLARTRNRNTTWDGLNKKEIIVKWLPVQLTLHELINVSYIADSIILFLARNSVSLLKRERLHECS